MGKPYEFLEHTADVKIRAYGKTLGEAFKNAAIATTAVMTDIKQVKETEEKKIRITANDRESLLYDFLQEMLYLLDTEGYLAKSVKRIKIQETKTGYELTATLIGDHAQHGYDVHTYIKAVTYNEMEINENEKGVIIQLVHDI